MLIDFSELETVRGQRFSRELINFRNHYEKPVLDAFKEADARIERQYKEKRFEERQKRRTKQKQAKRKIKQGTTLMRHMMEKEYWEKYIDALKIGNFDELPPKEQISFLCIPFHLLSFDAK